MERQNPWMEYMLNGEFEKAWQFSDQVMQSRTERCDHWPRHLQYVWRGASLENKKVLIRCYHGLGDTIQFIRFAPVVKQIAARVIVWAQPDLLPLLQTVEGIDELLPLHDGAPDVEYEVDVEVMELPHIFRITPESIPCRVPYFHVDPVPPAVANNRPLVGLVWKAGNWDHRRNIPFDQLKPLFEAFDNNIFIMQQNAKEAGWIDGFGIHPGEFTLHEYAARLNALDLLISIDSMPVHLAGALGVPVWNLLHASADWRWMKNRDDSPWYPHMRLFRQQKQGEWDYVIEKVIRQIPQIRRRAQVSLIHDEQRKPAA